MVEKGAKKSGVLGAVRHWLSMKLHNVRSLLAWILSWFTVWCRTEIQAPKTEQKDIGVQTSNLLLHQDIIKEMECRVCFKYMTSDIQLCNNGHSLCITCRKKLVSCPQCKGQFVSIRNRLAESISSKVFFPCQNTDAGCAVVITGENVEKHQLVCPSREYKCFLDDCEWVGRNYQLVDHFKVKHKANLLMGHENDTIWRDVNFSASKKMCYLIVVDEELFIHTQKINVTKSVLEYCMQYVGQKENADNFCYNLELVETDHHKAFFADSVLDDLKNAETVVFEMGKNLQITIPYIKGFIDIENKLVQKLKIISKK